MAVTFLSHANIQKILTWAAGPSHAIGMYYWVTWWLLKDKNRKSVTWRCSQPGQSYPSYLSSDQKWFELPIAHKWLNSLEAAMLGWLKYGFMPPNLSSVFHAYDKTQQENEQYALRHLMDWFYQIDKIDIKIDSEVESDLIRLLGLIFALMNMTTGETPDEDLVLDEKKALVQGYHDWLLLKYRENTEIITLFTRPLSDSEKPQKHRWFQKKKSSVFLDSASLSERMTRYCQPTVSQAVAAHLFLEYFLSCYDPGKGLRGEWEESRQPGTDFRVPAFDFMRTHTQALKKIDRQYEQALIFQPTPSIPKILRNA